MGTCAMSFMSLPRLGAIAAAILVPATLLHAALPTPTDAPEQASLTGQLLIAAPTMGDPRFQHTVILMVRHDRNGALGIVINRPIGERPLASVLEALGEKATAVAGQVRIFAGGPVQPEIGFVVHSAEYHRSDTVDIIGRVAMTSRPEQEPDRIRLRRLGAGPARGRACARLLVHDVARRQAHLRRRPRRGLGQRHEAPDAGPLTAREVEVPLQALFGLSVAWGFLAWGIVAARYLWPYLRSLPRIDALRPLLILHSFRFVGLAFLVPGVVAPELSAAFARPAAYGDLIAAVLALLALAALRSRWGMPLVWVFNLWGTADLLYAFYQGNSVGFAPGQLGAAYFIPTVIVPLLLITHGLMFRLLLRGEDARASP